MTWLLKSVRYVSLKPQLTFLRFYQAQTDVECRRPHLADPLLALGSTGNLRSVASCCLPDLELALTYMHRRLALDPRVRDLDDRRVLLEINDKRPQFRFNRSRPVDV